MSAREHSRDAVPAAPRRRLPWPTLLAVAFAIAIGAVGFSTGIADPVSNHAAGATASLHNPSAVVGSSALPEITPALLSGHAVAHADRMLAVAGPAAAVLAFALIAVRRSLARPVPALAPARRLPPRRGPPPRSFTR